MKLRGTSLMKGTTRWRAQIRVKGQTIYIGMFDTQEEAHAAFCEVYEHTYSRPFGVKSSIEKAKQAIDKTFELK